MVKCGTFIDLPDERGLKPTQKAGVALSRTPSVGVNRGIFTLLDVAGEWLREGGQQMIITCWSNTGAALRRVMLPWIEANRPKELIVGVREGVDVLQPGFIAGVQSLYGVQSLRVFTTHTEFTVVDDRVAFATNPLVPLCQFEWHLVLRDARLAECLRRLMLNLPVFGPSKYEHIQQPLFGSLEEVLDAWRV